MREASECRTVKDTDSYAFFHFKPPRGIRHRQFIMNKTLDEARSLVSAYNLKYNTEFVLEEVYTLWPDKDGEYGIKEYSWPGNQKAGVYLILDELDNIIYVGQSSSLGRRFYHYFKGSDGVCTYREGSWSATPKAIVAIVAPDDARYERLSLEEYLIERLQPVDNIRGK